MILKLDENDFSHGLVATYENAARKAGFPVTDGNSRTARSPPSAKSFGAACWTTPRPTRMAA